MPGEKTPLAAVPRDDRLIALSLQLDSLETAAASADGDAVLDSCSEEIAASLDAMIATRAVSLGGIATKLRECARRAPSGDTNIDSLVGSLLRDIEAMSC